MCLRFLCTALCTLTSHWPLPICSLVVGDFQQNWFDSAWQLNLNCYQMIADGFEIAFQQILPLFCFIAYLPAGIWQFLASEIMSFSYTFSIFICRHFVSKIANLIIPHQRIQVHFKLFSKPSTIKEYAVLCSTCEPDAVPSCYCEIRLIRTGFLSVINQFNNETTVTARCQTSEDITSSHAMHLWDKNKRHTDIGC